MENWHRTEIPLWSGNHRELAQNRNGIPLWSVCIGNRRRKENKMRDKMVHINLRKKKEAAIFSLLQKVFLFHSWALGEKKKRKLLLGNCEVAFHAIFFLENFALHFQVKRVFVLYMWP